jgi:hypothetical protein
VHVPTGTREPVASLQATTIRGSMGKTVEENAGLSLRL